ncbi:hypothetical protein B0H13DRAFT_2324697 [Mycena leptocephala]|nr:hypothetical protein B0H13DRAFT_2324697 [Mycena leptocephala]
MSQTAVGRHDDAAGLDTAMDVSHSPSIAIAYLVRNYTMSYDGALAFVERVVIIHFGWMYFIVRDPIVSIRLPTLSLLAYDTPPSHLSRRCLRIFCPRPLTSFHSGADFFAPHHRALSSFLLPPSLSSRISGLHLPRHFSHLPRQPHHLVPAFSLSAFPKMITYGLMWLCSLANQAIY